MLTYINKENNVNSVIDNSFLTSVKNWSLAARPKTLTASLVPVLVGTSLSYSLTQQVSWDLFFLTLLSVLFIQIGTNFVNDAADFRKGADTSERLGPQRVTQSGLFSEKQVWRAAFFSFVSAAICGLYLVCKGGWPIFLIGICSIVFGYWYTAGSKSLAYLGLGELFVFIFYGWVALVGLVYLYTRQWLFEALVLGTQLGLLCSTLISINNLRDVNQDIKANKKTMVVRFGVLKMKFALSLFFLLPVIIGFYWFFYKKYYVFIALIVTLPLTVGLIKDVYQTQPSRIYNKFLARASLIFLLNGLLISIGFIL